MKSSFLTATLLVGLLTLPSLAGAHDPKQHAAPKPAAIDAAAQPAIAAVEQFSKALQAADFKQVSELLADDVLILESGGAERTREEYLGGHAIQDALFLKNAHSQITHRTARVEGALAWIGTESELHTSKDGKPLTLLSTETMMLKNTAKGWKIVHIHWSSRPKKAEQSTPAAATTPSASITPATNQQHHAATSDTSQLLSGAGMGQSMVADANSVPGPRHVLDMAESLQLTTAQLKAVDDVYRVMHDEAVDLGHAVVASEATLGRLFLAQPTDQAAITNQVQRIASLRADLRMVHLRSHLGTASKLTVSQRQRYASLRH